MATKQRMTVGKCPTDALALTNKVFCPPGFFPADVKYVRISPVLAGGNFLYTLDSHPDMRTNELGFHAIQRKWMNLSLRDELEVAPFRLGPDQVASQLNLEIDFLKKTAPPKARFDTDDMAKQFLSTFLNSVFAVGEPFVFEYVSEKDKLRITFTATVKKILGIDVKALKSGVAGQSLDLHEGVVMRDTGLIFDVTPDSSVSLGGNSRGKSTKRSIINSDWSFESMGIGGLDTQFSTMFRRAFASRVMPLEVIEKLGIKHVRGMLLYGPPGTGKTLMARQIGKMLNGREPKIVNGPEILSKFVGESEANVRKLFEDAEAEYKAKGENSSLHIIIFDEIDAICKTRGTVTSGTGVNDSVVNQLLSKIDGVNSLNNILLIGMTNRIDMLDEALLRPGRLELRIQIGLPDEQGRFQIFMIHTKKMRDSNYLSPKVDLKELSARTKNFSGAEIEGLIRSAISFATHRCVKSTNIAEVDEASLMQLLVEPEDFDCALEEVIPAFGVSTEELSESCKNGIVAWGTPVARVLNDGKLFVKQVRNSDRTPLVSALLSGAAGSGKTALAAKLALDSGFPLVKMVSPERMVAYSEQARCAEITKVFEDAYKSPLSIVVVDDIERLLDYVQVGPRFSNMVLQCLMILFKKAPPQGHKLLILGTTSKRDVLTELGMMDVFSSIIAVENLNTGTQIMEALRSIRTFTEEELALIAKSVGPNSVKVELLGEAPLSIGIKKLFMLAEMAIQDADDRVGKFLYSLYEECRLGKGF